MPFLLAFNPLQPIVNALVAVLNAIHHVIPNLGWSMIVLAALIRIAFWPLSHMQSKSTAEMQKIGPLVKQLQQKYKGDPQKMNAEVMALYKEHGVNPMASCLPLLLQLPILFSLYQAIISEKESFASEHWAWIGASISQSFPHILARSLADPDYLLLALYIVSMYFSVRYGSPPSTDPQQQQMQKMMAFISPVMIAFIGRSWPSALILYWLASNVFTTAQMMYMFRRLGLMGGTAAPALADGKGGTVVKDVTPATARNGAGDGRSREARPANPKKRSRR